MVCVYVECDGSVCIFKSSATNEELPVDKSEKHLHPSDKCWVNFVEIIHDCQPRSVNLKLNFTTHSGYNKLYLQV